MKRLSYVGLFIMLFLIGCGKEKGQSGQCSQKFVNEYREVERCYNAYVQKRNECRGDCGTESVKEEGGRFVSKFKRLKEDFPQIKSCDYQERSYDMISLENKAKDAKDVIEKIPKKK